MAREIFVLHTYIVGKDGKAGEPVHIVCDHIAAMLPQEVGTKIVLADGLTYHVTATADEIKRRDQYGVFKSI